MDDPDFGSVLRGPDRAPPDSGQWGVALRYLAEDLNQTEFGLYYMNYHSRLPLVAAETAPREAIQAGLAAAQAVSSPGSNTTTAVQTYVQGLVASGNLEADEAATVITQLVGGIAGALAVDRFANWATSPGRYFLEYPPDIQLFGASFNTVLGTSGWALQGEYSMRRGAPLQRAERTVLAEGLSPILRPLQQDPTFDINEYVPYLVRGYVKRNVSQIQATATKVYGPVLNSDALVFVAEAAAMHVHNMPAEPIESPAGGILPDPVDPTNPYSPAAYDADATSWGYRLAMQLDYNNAVGSTNLHPYTQFLHDVHGNSPAPSGPFVEGRTALTLGLRADYLSSWQADIGWTRFAGDGNELSDRDFISASVKYSF